MKRSRQRNIWKRTYKNKICAMVILVLGLLTLQIENDGTFLAFSVMLTLPLLIAKKNYVN